jgi:hypothetical protein
MERVRFAWERAVVEIDPDPTEPTRDCPVPGCPCRILERSANAWGAAAAAVSLLDGDAGETSDDEIVLSAGRVIDFTPKRGR